MVKIVESFDRIYEQRFGKGAGSRAAVLEITNCHLHLVRQLPKVAIAPRTTKGSKSPVGTRKIYRDGWTEVPVHRWDDLPAGASFSGPALVDSAGTTVWVSPDHTARVDQFGNLRLEAI
jgi:N-methylhydantoinase A